MRDDKLIEAMGFEIENTACVDQQTAENAARAALAAIREQVPEENPGIVRRMTAAMREADAAFAKGGGTTRHYVRECVLPVLRKHGLLIAAAPQFEEDEK